MGKGWGRRHAISLAKVRRHTRHLRIDRPRLTIAPRRKRLHLGQRRDETDTVAGSTDSATGSRSPNPNHATGGPPWLDRNAYRIIDCGPNRDRVGESTRAGVAELVRGRQ